MEYTEPIVEGHGETPLVVITPHSSTHVPEELADRLAISEQEMLRFTDIGSDTLYDGVVDLGGTIVRGSINQLILNLTTNVTRLDDGSLKYFKPGNKNMEGSFPHVIPTADPDVYKPIFEPELTEKERSALKDCYHTPFFKAIDEAVSKAQSNAEEQYGFPFSVLVDGHTFPDVTTKGKKKNAHFVLGTREWGTADPKLIHAVMQELASTDVYNIGIDNYGWDGGYSTGHYSLKANPNTHAIQVDMSKALFEDFTGAHSYDRTSIGYSLTKHAILNMLVKITEWAPTRPSE